ncbi:hypothetical protein [Bartonella henselae]|uniref:hypothetical protein n=1 Tax=Bartonella henselae TaxID=38323 RepID=UPI002E355E34|nr:hypothetical protein [Bartonella henselae]
MTNACLVFAMGLMVLSVALLPMMIGCLADCFPMHGMRIFYFVVMLAVLLERSYKLS